MELNTKVLNISWKNNELLRVAGEKEAFGEWNTLNEDILL